MRFKKEEQGLSGAKEKSALVMTQAKIDALLDVSSKTREEKASIILRRAIWEFCCADTTRGVMQEASCLLIL